MALTLGWQAAASPALVAQPLADEGAAMMYDPRLWAIWAIEITLMEDIDGDGHIGQPPTPPPGGGGGGV